MAVVAAAGPGRGGGGSPELDKMAAGELAGAGKDGGDGGRVRGRLPWTLGFAASFLKSARSKAIILIEREIVDDKEVKRKGKGEDIKQG